MIDIALVSYINTRPFIDGFSKVFDEREVRFHLMPPSDSAKALKRGEVAMALMPIGALVNFEHVHLLPSYCIGGDGPVNSVFIFSHVPIEEVTYLYLDPHSRSSNGLARILMKHYWNKNIPFQMLPDRPFEAIGGSRAGVIIGDRAIKSRDDYPYVYDLSEYWKKLTGLSFPFAVWAYNPELLDAPFLSKIEEAMRIGIDQRKESALRWADHYGIPLDFAIQYLEKDIDFRFDHPKHQALKLYQKALIALPELELQAI